MARKKLNLKLNIKAVPFGELQKYENNPRVNEDGIDPTKESLSKFGYQQPIVVTKDNVIICGHTRLEALKKLGVKDTDEIDVQVFNGTADDAKAYRLVDNKSGEFSGWDFELLDMEMQDISLNLDPWFPTPEDDDFEPTDSIEADDVEYTTDTGSSESSEKKHIVCPHCGQVIEL